jgi:pimeloyl-ACP methyl ester carboxylesterase
VAGAADTLIPEAGEARSARHYGATYVSVPEAGHNLMMEKSWRETAVLVHEWLAELG